MRGESGHLDGDKVVLAGGTAWQVKERIGDPSGLAIVHRGESTSGEQVALKFIKKEEGADRELLFTDLADDVPNVIPILDSGDHGDYWVLVMPLADRSLRQHLIDAGGPLALEEGLSVLTDVAEALAALQPRVVHRDLKPANVLLWNGRWRLADFGISRYAETTTAEQTRKLALTPPYASPEQWRFEHAESPADIYAFGVMAFQMIEGQLPFPGPDFRDAHLYQQPPDMKVAPALLESLIKECMFKPPQARPTAAKPGDPAERGLERCVFARVRQTG